MSENKRPNTRKNRWWRSVAAVVSTVALGVGGVAVPPVAGAWVQTDLQPAWGPEEGPRAEVTTEVKRSVEHPESEADKTFNYEVTVNAVAPNPVEDPTFAELNPGESAIHADGAGSYFILTFKPDENAPVIEGAEPTFKWDGLADGIEPYLRTDPDAPVSGWIPEEGVYRYFFVSNAPKEEGSTLNYGSGWMGNNVTLKATFPAQVKEDVPADYEYHAAANGEAFVLPTARFNYAKDAWLIDQCTLRSQHTFKLDSGGYGGWLRDIKLGSEFPDDQNETVGQPTISVDYVSEAGDPAESAIWRSNDTEAPPEWTLSPRLRGKEINWMNSWNWEFDKNTRTGKQWVADGTVITITHDVRNTQCASNPDEFLGTAPTEIANSTANLAEQALPRVAEANGEMKWRALTFIGDRVWVDLNGNGIQDPDEQEGVPGVKVTVSREGEPDREVVTADDGAWRVEGITPGAQYDVNFELPTDGDYADYSVTETGKGERGEDSNGLSFTTEQIPATGDLTYDLGVYKPASVGDFVWEDSNGNGIQDEGEPPVAGVTVTVSAEGEDPRTVTTDKKGRWKVDGLTPGVEYTVKFTAPEGYSVTKTEEGEDRGKDSNPLSSTVTLKSGENNTSYDLGLVKPCDCVPTTVKQPVPTTVEKAVPTTVKQPVPTTVEKAVPTTVKQPVPTTVEKAVPTTVKKAVPTTVKQPVPTTVEKEVPTTVEKAVPTTVRTTTTAEAPKSSTIGDKVWEDTNGDGKEDPDENTGIPNVPVVIVDKDGNEVTRTVSDEDGNWKVDVEPGEYTVRYEPGDRTPSDKEQVERTIVIEPGKDRDDIDLGVLPSGSVGDRVWNDEDGDGKQGENEKGLENVVVLVSREGEPTRSAVTDANGDWKIEALNPNAEYDIRFVKPDGWEVTGKVPGSDESGLVSKVTVKPNEYNDTYDLGLKKLDPDCDCEPVKPGTIGNRVWIDLNGNGKQDPNETEGVPDVTVIVRDKDGNEVTRTVTDEDGNWKVNVEPGDYEIEYRPRDWKPTDPKRVTQKVTVEEGKEYLDLDLGVQKPKPGEPTPPTEKPEKGSSTETLDRCVANAVRSPLLYLVPVALLGAFGGEIARPYMGAINEQVNQINAQFQEAMRRNSPDWGHGGRGGRDNDQFAELRGQIDAANRRIAELGQDPNVQRFGTVAAGIIGLIAAGGVLYDWCSNEKGEAFTSIGGSSAKESGAEGRQSSSKDAA